MNRRPRKSYHAKEYIKKESKRIPFQDFGELKPCYKLFSAWSSLFDKPVKKPHEFKRNLLHMILICNQMLIPLKLGNNFIVSLVNIRLHMLIVILNEGKRDKSL